MFVVVYVVPRKKKAPLFRVATGYRLEMRSAMPISIFSTKTQYPHIKKNIMKIMPPMMLPIFSIKIYSFFLVTWKNK